MKTIQQHSTCPDIVVAREERTLIFLMLAIACLIMSFGVLVWSERVIGMGNVKLESVRERLNVFSIQLDETKRTCEQARDTCNAR
jgi:hypothetical protein